ncbi:MAG: MFS transporter [Planctomycetota bacterium]
MLESSLVPRLAGMMFLQFFVWGAWFVTIGNFVVAEGTGFGPIIGEDVRGWVYTAPAIAAVLSPVFLGMIADRFFATQRVLAVLHVLGGGLMLLLPSYTKAGDDGLFGWIVFAYMLCYMPTLGLTSALAFRHLPDRERQFPIVRVFGTIGWIVAGLVVSQVLEADEKSVQFVVAGAASIALGVFAWTLPHTEPPGRGQAFSLAESLGIRAVGLLRDKNFLIFALSSFLVCLPLAAYYAFAQSYAKVVGYEAPGATMTVGQGAEVLFMLVMPWCFRRLGVKWMLAVGMAAWGVRYGLFALAAEEQVRTLVLAGIALHGICYDFFFVTGQIYVDRFASSEIRGQAQGFLVLLTQGLGIGLGTRAMVWLHSEVTEVNGDQKITDWETFWAAPAGAALIVLVFFMMTFRERGLPVQESEV